MGEAECALTLERRLEKKKHMSEGPLCLDEKMSRDWFFSQHAGVLCHTFSTVNLLIMTHG